MNTIYEKALKNIINIFKFKKIKYLKNYSINQTEIVILSLAFYLNSIISARNLTTIEYGNYAIIYSIFNLIQGGYVCCIGETFLIKKSSQYIKQSIGEIIFFIKYLVIVFIILGLILYLLFDVNLKNIFIYFISTFNLIIMQNNRYYFLSYNLNKKSIINSILFLLIFTISLLLLTSLEINISSSYLYFSLLGFSAFLINLKNLTQIDFRNRVSKLKENKKFILKSLYSNILYWCSGNFHWILLGYFSRESLGIIRACLAVINPIQTISRGMSITVYKILNNNNNLRTFFKLSIVALIISLITLFIWHLAPYKILEFTIGKQYFSYKNEISIIMCIPGLGFIASMGNAFLKFNNYFKPIYLSNILISFFLTSYIILNQDNYNIYSLAIVILLAVIINLSVISHNVIKKLSLGLSKRN